MAVLEEIAVVGVCAAVGFTLKILPKGQTQHGVREDTEGGNVVLERSGVGETAGGKQMETAGEDE